MELDGEVLVVFGVLGVLAEGDGAGVVAEDDLRWWQGQEPAWQKFAEQATKVYNLARGFVEGDVLGVARGRGDIMNEAAGEGDGGQEVVEADDVSGGRLVFLGVTAEIGVGVHLDEELAAGVPEVDAVVAGDAQVMKEGGLRRRGARGRGWPCCERGC